MDQGLAFGCGRCLPCRISKRREWVHRMMLEAAQYTDNCFATLTYSDEALPSDLSVSPEETTNFIKRLRKAGLPFRYFIVGEYGHNTGRPHYHAALFGFPPCAYGISRKRPTCCPICTIVHKAWGRGQILLGSLEPKSMAYIVGYISKRMTRHDDPRLEGRLPEFSRMSLRPGIGHGMMHDLASQLMEYKLDVNLSDVPAVLQHGTKQYPLGRYLRRSVRKLIGRSPNAPPETLQAAAETLRAVREAAYSHSKPFKTALLENTLGKRIQIEARERRSRKKWL